jgi:hypothetical protein
MRIAGRLLTAVDEEFQKRQGSSAVWLPMSKSEILAELPALSRPDRREILQRLFELEEDMQLLNECDRRADEHFLMLDAMESDHAKTQAG